MSHIKYDIALSFAASNRNIAREIHSRLTKLGYAVFLDEDAEHELWGANAKEYFARVFGREAAYCLVLISKDYDERGWTLFEREVIQSRQLSDQSNFLLPVTTDSYRPTWLPATRIYFDLENRSLDDLISLIVRKVVPRGGGPGVGPQVTAANQARLKWTTASGIGTWKSKPEILADRVLFPTAGAEWNKPDVADGLHCLDRTNGRVLWVARTDHDCNAVLVEDEIRAYVGTDGGDIYCFDIEDGRTIWRSACGSPILAKPARTGQGILIATATGEIRVLDESTGTLIGYASTQGGVVADPIIVEDNIYLATTAGWLYELPIDQQVPTIGKRQREHISTGRHLVLTYPSEYELTGQAACSFHGTPAVWGNMIALPYVRYTYFPGVPITMVHRSSMQQLWPTAVHNDVEREFGNVRCTPLVSGNVLVAAPAYGNEIVGIDRAGGVTWVCAAGRAFFPQWGSPAAYGNSIIAPRYDGFIHAVNSLNGTREWSMFLGRGHDAGKYFGPQEELPGMLSYPEWKNTDAYALNSPAAEDNGEVYLCSSEGFAFCIDLQTT